VLFAHGRDATLVFMPPAGEREETAAHLQAAAFEELR